MASTQSRADGGCEHVCAVAWFVKRPGALRAMAEQIRPRCVERYPLNNLQWVRWPVSRVSKQICSTSLWLDGSLQSLLDLLSELSWSLKNFRMLIACSMWVVSRDFALPLFDSLNKTLMSGIRQFALNIVWLFGAIYCCIMTEWSVLEWSGLTAPCFKMPLVASRISEMM